MSQRVSVRLSTLAASVLVLGSAVGCQGGASGATPTNETATEQAGLSKIVEAFKKFHEDTGAWPMAGTAWSVADHTQIDPLAFDASDTALFTMPTSLKQCSSTVAKPCWNGPYLEGKSLDDAAFHDAWGHARLYTLIRPMDGFGGGVQAAPEGAVIVWSAGADGVDGLGCTDASCARDWDLLAKGIPSADKADDVINVVGHTAVATK